MKAIFYILLLCAASVRTEEPLSDPGLPALEAAEPAADSATSELPPNSDAELALPDVPVERNLKDSYVDTVDLNEISAAASQTSLAVDDQGHHARRLQDGNPIFKSEYHHQPIDYFQIVLYEFDRNVDRLSQVRRFLLNWMKIDPARESMTVTRYQLSHHSINNRYQVTYANSGMGVSKVYYIDVDFTDGRSDRSRVPRVRTIDYLHSSNSNNNYLKLFQYTVEEDCRAIREAQHNPAEATCRMYRTNDNFVVPHVYDVQMRYVRGSRTVLRRGRFFVRSRIIGPESSPLTPEPVDLPTPPEIIRMVTDRVRRTPFFESKSLVLRQLAHRTMVDRISVYTNQIARWEMQNKDRMRNAEQNYHVNLRRALVNDRRNKRRDNMNFDRTYSIMRRSASRINAFNIRSIIRRTARRLEDLQTIRAHRAKARYYQREMALMDLMERLDHMRYLADRHLDENFDHYYSPEYFKKA